MGFFQSPWSMEWMMDLVTCEPGFVWGRLHRMCRRQPTGFIHYGPARATMALDSQAVSVCRCYRSPSTSVWYLSMYGWAVCSGTSSDNRVSCPVVKILLSTGGVVPPGAGVAYDDGTYSMTRGAGAT